MYRRSFKNKNNLNETGLSIETLKKVVTVLGFETKGKSGPDGNSDHNQIEGLERTAKMILGPSPLFWSNIIQTKYKNEELGQELYKSYRPLLPKTVQWLFYDSILEALRVYENEPKFMFACYGPFTPNSDWNPSVMQTDRFRMAFIINLSANGSHWVILYTDLLQGENNYFDSMGLAPTESVRKTTTRIFDVLKKFYPTVPISRKVWFSKNRKQHGVTECGVYIVWFIAQRLNGASFRQINNTKFTDNDCRKLRGYFWNLIDLNTEDFEIKK